ncbi:MAG: ATP-binding cassette domain-containing protein [Planctomycetes bacterium]|nr:ATP-binding cassette domain-containing protein [Planctomycetota bacterium]
MTILETQSITRRFGDLTAVDNFSLAVKKGECFGLLGPNGAGKTTLIKMLITLLPPSSGSATVGGFDIIKQDSSVRRIIGYVPQMISADGSLTGYENLYFFARLYDITRKESKLRVNDALAFMGLSDVSDKLVRKYSGGMIRRLEIAQSMVHRPLIMFLDEPTVGLDPIAREAVWKHIRNLQSEFGTTIFLTTHHMEEADELCDRVAIMHLGKMVALGTPKELKKSIEKPDATLNDVFIHYAKSELTSEGNYREISRTRRTAKRLG